MEETIFMILLILAFLIPICFCLWLIYISYSIPSKSGNKKLGIILSILATIALFYIAYSIFFDESISKKDVRNYIQEHSLSIREDFEILENESMSGIGEYYHTFTLKIADSDKQNLISEIQKSNNFRKSNEPSLMDYENKNYKVGDKIIDNIETENHFIRVVFIENEEGFADTYRIIKINKANNRLQFEDIDE